MEGPFARPGPGHCQVCGWPLEKYGCTEEYCELPYPGREIAKAAAEFRDTLGHETGIYRLLDRLTAWLNGLRKG